MEMMMDPDDLRDAADNLRKERRERGEHPSGQRQPHPLVGRRVRLVSCSDPYTRLTAGEEGTVGFVDSLGTLHVDWDSGSSLGLVDGHDRYVVLG